MRQKVSVQVPESLRQFLEELAPHLNRTPQDIIQQFIDESLTVEVLIDNFTSMAPWNPDWKYILREKNVEIFEESGPWLKCRRCKGVWNPPLQANGLLPKGYWKCLGGCNVE